MNGIVGDYAIRRQYAADGLTLTEAAAQLGITRSGLYQWARKHGVAFAAHQAVMPSVKLEGPRLTEEEVAARLSCYAAGMTLRQAAAHLGVTYAAMRHWTRRSGLRFCRVFVGNHRLPAEEDAARRACAADGLTVSQAARKLGMSVSALWMWAHRAGVEFVKDQGGGGRPRSGRQQGRSAPKPAKPPAPLSGSWMAARLTEGERADFKLLRGKGGYSALQALASIRRPDLVAEVEAHLKTRKAAA